ncbi:hypothetical protein WJT74_11995 [Sphingomicrobium sp. XHP0239]|uniref:hypothetical protein n=1 Tax=Sphingomicrobium maritimum TaxID=3133972 RepID=UPI0031CC8F03
MAKGNLEGPLGPIMLMLLAGVALLMIVATQSPELASKFERPEDFYDNTPSKVGIALIFAVVVSIIVALIRKLLK